MSEHMALCKHCNEPIYKNKVNNRWYHNKGYISCMDSVTHARPKSDTSWTEIKSDALGFDMAVKPFSLHDLKPSELPEGTVIDDERHGEYIKRADDLWEEMDADYMGDRERVTDIGLAASGMTREAWRKRYPSLVWTEPAEEYFKDYKVISLPVSVTDHLVGLAHHLMSSNVPENIEHLVPTHEDLFRSAISQAKKASE